MWERNRDVLLARWPDVLDAVETAPSLGDDAGVLEGTPVPTLVVGGLQLTSAYDRTGEARAQAELVPFESERAVVYGFALGDLPRELLARTSLRELDVVLLNRAIAQASLLGLDHTDWLADPRVRLVLGERESDVRGPFAAAPGELALAADECAQLRDRVQVELGAPWAAKRIAERDDELRAAMDENRPLIAADGDAAELFATAAGSTVTIAGAGPSLVESEDALRERTGPLIAADTALRPLLRLGIVPDVVVSIDSHLAGMAKAFSGELGACRESTLAYFPVVPAEVLVRWPGRRVVAYGEHPRWAELARELPRATLWSSGSVVHVAVDLAVRMGAARVELAGCDFGFPGGRSHAAGALHAREAETPGETWVADVRGERLRTQPNLVAYLRDLERYVEARPGVEFRNLSRSGASIAGCPPASREVVS